MLAVALIAVLLAVTSAVVVIGSAVAARHRAQAAADLAALAGAGRLASGPETACQWSGSVATAMGVRVVGCRVDGLDVVVTAEAAVRLGRLGVGTARATARAGPALSGRRVAG